MCFLPAEAEPRERAVAVIEETVEAEGQRVLGWREVPVDPGACGTAARASSPHVAQLFVGARRGRVRPGRARAQALRDPAA